MTDTNTVAAYIATKADIAELKEALKGLDRTLDVRLRGIEALQEERSAALRDVFGRVQTATDKSELAQHNVNKAQNEFRGALNDQAKLLASRPELESLDKRVQALERGASGGAGKSSGFDQFSSKLISIIAVLISLASLALLIARLK